MVKHPKKGFLSRRVEHANELMARVRNLRRIRLLTSESERRVIAKRNLPFRRVFANKKGELFGLEMHRRASMPGSYRLSLYRVEGSEYHLVAGASVKFGKRSAVIFDVGKGSLAVDEDIFRIPHIHDLYPKGLDVIRPFLEMIQEEAFERGLKYIELNTMKKKLVDYYARFGFRVMPWFRQTGFHRLETRMRLPVNPTKKSK